jgi:hypothetical protein
MTRRLATAAALDPEIMAAILRTTQRIASFFLWLFLDLASFAAVFYAIIAITTAAEHVPFWVAMAVMKEAVATQILTHQWVAKKSRTHSRQDLEGEVLCMAAALVVHLIALCGPRRHRATGSWSRINHIVACVHGMMLLAACLAVMYACGWTPALIAEVKAIAAAVHEMQAEANAKRKAGSGRLVMRW